MGVLRCPPQNSYNLLWVDLKEVLLNWRTISVQQSARSKATDRHRNIQRQSLDTELKLYLVSCRKEAPIIRFCTLLVDITIFPEIVL